MKILVILLIVIVTIPAYADTKIISLTNTTFEETLSKNYFTFVVFYTSNCQTCDNFLEQLEKASDQIGKDRLDIALAKISSTEGKEYIIKYELEDLYPSMILFVHGYPIPYTGGNTNDDIYNWLKRRTTEESQEFDNLNEFTQFLNDFDVVCIFFGEKNQDFKSFEKASKAFEDVRFGNSKLKEILNFYKAEKNTIVLFKQFEEKRMDYKGPFNVEDIITWIMQNQTPLIMPFNAGTAENVFTSPKPVLVLCYNSEEKSTEALSILKIVAYEIKNKFLIASSRIDEGIGERMGEYLELTNVDLPGLRILHLVKDEVKRYFFTAGDITKDKIMKFISDFENGLLKASYRSENTDFANDKPLKKIVGKTWDRIVLDNNKDVLVTWTAPFCSVCKTLVPVLEKLAATLENNKNIVIGIIQLFSYLLYEYYIYLINNQIRYRMYQYDQWYMMYDIGN